MCTCACHWHTNTYTVTLAQKYILFAPGTLIGKYYKWLVHLSHLSTMSFTPCILFFARPYGSVSVTCHPEGKVHISQTGAKGLGRTGV